MVYGGATEFQILRENGGNRHDGYVHKRMHGNDLLIP